MLCETQGSEKSPFPGFWRLGLGWLTFWLGSTALRILRFYHILLSYFSHACKSFPHYTLLHRIHFICSYCSGGVLAFALQHFMLHFKIYPAAFGTGIALVVSVNAPAWLLVL